MSGRHKREIANLPTWQVRLKAWSHRLRHEVSEQKNIQPTAITKAILYKYIFEHVPAQRMSVNERDKKEKIFCDISTFSRWLSQSHYPQYDSLYKLCRAEPSSGEFLNPKASESRGAPALLSSIDYYLCSVNTELQPHLFDSYEQKSFSERCLKSIAQRWQIPFIKAGDNDWSRQFDVNDISLTMLHSHGAVAIPYYLASLSAANLITDEESLEWYIDMLCSCLLVTGMLYRESSYRSTDVFHSESKGIFATNSRFKGSSYNLLHYIGNFLYVDGVQPYIKLKMGISAGDLDEIENGTGLLESVLKGHTKLVNLLRNLKIDCEIISKLLRQYSTIHELCPLEGLRANQPLIVDAKPSKIDSKQLILYHLETTPTRRVDREVIYQNGRRQVDFLACKHPLSTSEGHYSWGYHGTGVEQMAYTLLYDLMNLTGPQSERQVPNDIDVTLVVDKLLSKITSGEKYTISSKQIVACLNGKRAPTRMSQQVFEEYARSVNGRQ